MFSRIRKIVLIAACLTFLFSAGRLVLIYMDYHAGEEEYSELEEVFLKPVQTENSAEPKSPEKQQEQTAETSAGTAGENDSTEIQEAVLVYVDFEALKAMNGDAKGWITVGGTKINYPVVQTTDNEYYLKHTFKKEKNAAGAIFIEEAVSEGMEGKNVIVYGHNMKNGSMFGTLSSYKNASFAKAHPSFVVYTENGTYEYAVFAAFMTTAVSDAYTYGFASSESFLDYISRMKENSFYDMGVEVFAEDKIMTLSTCSGSTEERFVVLAKRMGKME